MKKADVGLLLLFVILTVGLTVQQLYAKYSSHADQVQIYSDGHLERVLKMPLEDTSFNIRNAFGYNEITIKSGKISMTDADCNDKLCVHSKPIEFGGEMIVCLPHKVYIEIKSSDVSELDGLSQ